MPTAVHACYLSLLLCAQFQLGNAYERIAGYSPASLVTDYNAIDLDLDRIYSALEDESPSDYARVYKIYTQGGSSESTATIKFASGNSGIKRGDSVSGDNEGGSGSSTGSATATGQVISVNSAGTEIRVEYTVPSKQSDSHGGCRVGGLAPKDYITDGCFQPNAPITIGTATYTPSSIDNTLAGRTLQEFSLSASAKLRSCSIGCPYWLYMQYANFYGDDDYGDMFVKAAMGTPANTYRTTKIGYKKHDMDFTDVDGMARFELIEKGISFLNVGMYVYRMLEVAVDQCKPNEIAANDAAVRSWDGAAAFYTGSLEGEKGNLEKGVMPHNQADKRCHNFKTCGPEGGSTTGTSMVNHKIFRIMQEGQSALLMGNCDVMPKHVRDVVSQMAIPMIQGAIRYAQINSRSGDDKPTNAQKAQAEGAAFAAAIVPRIAACPGGESDAEFLWEKMKMGAPVPYPYKDIKWTFEKYYSCLNITCAEVGGFFDNRPNGGGYYPDSSPCYTADSTPILDNGQIVGVVIGGLVAAVLCVCVTIFVWRLIANERKGKPVFTSLAPTSSSNGQKPTEFQLSAGNAASEAA